MKNLKRFFINKKLICKVAPYILAVTTPFFIFTKFENINAFSELVVDNDIKYTLNEEDKTACLSDGTNLDGNIEIPGQIMSDGVTYKVISIGERAFERSRIQGIILPNEVEKIQNRAFEHCEELTAVSFGENLHTIEDDAFFWSGITSLKIPDKTIHVGSMAFGSCTRLRTAILPLEISYLGEQIFAGCTLLESITIPDNIKTIPDKSFYGCEKLTDIKIPDSVEIIGEYAFAHCKINEIKFPLNLKIIKGHAFYHCPELSYIVLPDGLAEIGDEAFAMCENISCIEVPGSILSIGSHAFGGANPNELTKLKKVICVKDSYIDNEKPFFFWVQYGATYPEFSYKVAGASASGSIFGEYSFMAYAAVGIFLIAMIAGIVIVFRNNDGNKTIN